MLICHKCWFGHRTVEELRACKSWAEMVAEEAAEKEKSNITPASQNTQDANPTH